jgi:hypothetical protein
VDQGASPAVAEFVKANPDTPMPKATDLAVVFFKDFSKNHPGMFPSADKAWRASAMPPIRDAPRRVRSSRRLIFAPSIGAKVPQLC